MMDNNEPEKKSGVSAIVIGIAVLICCICTLVVGMGGYGYYAYTQMAPTATDNPSLPPADVSTPASPSENLFRPPSDTISTDRKSVV